MPIQQTKIHPTDLQVHGDPNTGEVWLHYRTGDDSATSIQLSPKLLCETVLNLFLCASQSKIQDVRAAAQLLATRELRAKVHPGPMLVLEQELECGASMTLTLDPKDADRLAREIDSGLAMIGDVGSSAAH